MRLKLAQTQRAQLGTLVVAAAASAALCIPSAPAQAATAVYPNGGSGFNTDPEGWSPGAVSCTPAAVQCTPEAAYDSSVGNPPGSISARTTVMVNLADLFKGTETWNSPQFKIPGGAVTGAHLQLDRAFRPGGLAEVGPKGTYTVTLRDLSTGAEATVVSEEVGKESSAFVTQSAPATLTGGHTYQLSIQGTTVQSTLSLSPTNGTTNLYFDNVSLVVETAGGGSGSNGESGGEGGNGGNGLTRAHLRRLLRGGVSLKAVLRRGRISVLLRCPAKIRHACGIHAQGLLGKRRPATSVGRVKVAKGKARLLVLRVKSGARQKVGGRRRLLFRETVRAGGARATVYRRLRLIRR